MKTCLPLSRTLISLSSICAVLVTGCATQSSLDRETRVARMVDDAAALVASHGETAFSEFQKPGSRWRHGDDYLFVSKADGTLVFHPTRPDLVGQNQLELTDMNGKEFIREMLEVVDKKGAGWVDYMWPKPGSSEPVPKASYVRSTRIGDENVIVGAGLYRE